MAVGYASAQDGAAAAGAEETAAANIPATSYWGVRGLSQTVSAEPLGAGRFNIAAFGSYFKQEQTIAKPEKDADIGLGRAALAWGANNYLDVFAIFPITIAESKFNGLGDVVGGVQLSLPLPEESIFKLAGQVHLIWGLSKNNFTTLNPDYSYGEDDSTSTYDSYAGYDFFDTRRNIDFVFKLAESFVFNGQSRRHVVKLHLNEGISFTTGGGVDWLLLGAAGLQYDPVEFLTIGAELNWRTLLTKISISDPLWITPSIMFRSPWFFGVLFGADFDISKKKEIEINNNMVTATKPLEKWRVFGDIVVSFDFLAPKREADARRAKEEAAEKARLESEAKRLAAEKENLAQKAAEDSIRVAEEMARRAEADSLRAKAVADSLAHLVNAVSQKAKADSIAQAQATHKLLADAEAKRVADSLARADLEQKLSEEKAKRTEAEQYLLTTGMLVLDAVYFTSGKADLHINSKPYLGTIAKMLVKYPKLKIEIGGHTDNIGGFETNMNLSRRRAEAVFLQMVNTEPSLAQMLTSRGYGSTVPKADNKTAGGRELNRRVELKVLNPEVLKDYNP
jgi:outer membrane protein OmpA-like peptidoglycan-associated protein